MAIAAVVPQSIKTDPKEIPLLGCGSADKLAVDVIIGDDNVKTFKADIVIFAVLASQTDATSSSAFVLPSAMQEYDKQCADMAMKEMIDIKDFKPKLGTSCTCRLPAASAVRAVALLGIGKASELTTTKCPKIGAEIAQIFKSQKSKTAGIVFPSELQYRDVQAIMETVFLSSCPDNRFKSDESRAVKKPSVEKLTILMASGKSASEVEFAVKRAREVAKGVYFAQELVAAPANYCNTVTLSNAALSMANCCGLSAKILDLDEIEKLGMGSYLAVAKGSMFPPKFIHLTYTPSDGGVKKRLAFIGKGLCFDSGGYNIKNAACHIEMMKIDMGGAAAVLGAAKTIGLLKPKNIEVHFIVAAAENMVSEKAYRPGDIITASNGKTIEVGNTDAEGRLTLADALVYAERLNVNCIVDLATLTGACVVALGPKYAGVWSSDDAFLDELVSSAATSGEYLWKMPLASEYRECLDSKIADLNNIGGQGKGGAILAALFLKEFVQKTPWAHIDIAGPAWEDKESRATGFGVRTLTELAIAKS